MSNPGGTRCETDRETLDQKRHNSWKNICGRVVRTLWQRVMRWANVRPTFLPLPLALLSKPGPTMSCSCPLLLLLLLPTPRLRAPPYPLTKVHAVAGTCQEPAQNWSQLSACRPGGLVGQGWCGHGGRGHGGPFGHGHSGGGGAAEPLAAVARAASISGHISAGIGAGFAARMGDLSK